jgi:hypothetical protein
MTSVLTYPWYETVAGDLLEQGDIRRNLDIVLPAVDESAQGDTLRAEIQTFDVVVMTQSCDIQHNKVDNLLLCPWWDLWDFVRQAQSSGQNWGTKIRDALRKGNLPGYHLLNEASQDGIELGLAVVDFHCVYTSPLARVKDHAAKHGKRLRLCPPYREHLSQSFARFFMRVGLPVDIPEAKLKI